MALAEFILGLDNPGYVFAFLILALVVTCTATEMSREALGINCPRGQEPTILRNRTSAEASDFT